MLGLPVHTAASGTQSWKLLQTRTALRTSDPTAQPPCSSSCPGKGALSPELLSPGSLVLPEPAQHGALPSKPARCFCGFSPAWRAGDSKAKAKTKTTPGHAE